MLRRRGRSGAKSGGLREFAAMRAAGRRGSVAAFCARLTPVNMFLLECFAFGSRLSICFYWGVLRLLHACLFSFVRKRETACDMFRSCSAVGRDRHSCVLGCRAVIGLGWFTSGLRVSLWRSRQRTKETERTRGTRERSRRRGMSALLRDHIGFAVFSAGSTLGLRAPDCAKESSTLWTLFIWFAAWMRFTRRGGTRV